MIISAKSADLHLPEYGAFNFQSSSELLWELPFALFNSRLSNTTSIIDCSVDSGNLGEKLSALFPHTLYRRHHPLQDGQFAPLLGVPDGSFDRAISINTFERIPGPRRAEYLAELGNKLKPGGMLIFTSKYCPGSALQAPAISAAPVLVCDAAREAQKTKLSKAAFLEYLELCRQSDLYPFGEVDADLISDCPDWPSTDVNGEVPYDCVAGIFYKSHKPNLTGKKILYALLCWNTREVTAAALRALLAEARMLSRLGHHPFLCVCDNGSDDGTTEALSAAVQGLEVPYQLIFNPLNLGSSIARNQIIECMREYGADYLLFTDGDIEIVPFSSFAMLQYMESNGPEIGAVGPHLGPPHQTQDRCRTNRYLYCVDPRLTKKSWWFAPTWYGLFRRAVFDSGIRFDENPPFDGPGWGFEDNDLAFQMRAKGYVTQFFFGMTHLHSTPHSSVRIMRRESVDAEALFYRRKEYMLKKWRNASPNDDVPAWFSELRFDQILPNQ